MRAKYSRMPDATKSFRRAQRALFMAGIEYAAAITRFRTPGQATTIEHVQALEDQLQERAVEFAFAAARFADEATGGAP